MTKHTPGHRGNRRHAPASPASPAPTASSASSADSPAASAQSAAGGKGRDERSVSIPLALRVGGAFLALALVLVVMVIIAVFTEGWMTPFVWTPSRLALVAAAVILGAFATVRRDQKASLAQVIGLACAVVLIVASRFVPDTQLAVMQQPWLLMYAGAAIVCALILRRTAAPADPAEPAS